MTKILSFVFILVFSLFLSVRDCFADEVRSELNNNFSQEFDPNNIKNNKNEKTDIPNVSNEDIFGDEQTFPFIAGLGKNAAH